MFNTRATYEYVEIPKFLSCARAWYPQHSILVFDSTVLGFRSAALSFERSNTSVVPVEAASWSLRYAVALALAGLVLVKVLRFCRRLRRVS